MGKSASFFYILTLIVAPAVVRATEFTFDLLKNAEECFFEQIKEGVECEFEFQVGISTKNFNHTHTQLVECSYSVEIHSKLNLIVSFKVVSGGKLDVDVIVESPTRKIIYKHKRMEHDIYKFNTSVSGFLILFVVFFFKLFERAEKSKFEIK